MRQEGQGKWRVIHLRNQRFLVRRDSYAEFWDRLEHSEWEPETLSALNQFICSEGSLLIDVGAWIGPVSLYAAAGGAKVVAFEPDPIAYAELAANVAANPSLNIEIHRTAVGRRSGYRSLKGEQNGNSMSSLALGRGSQHGGTSVPVVDFVDASASWDRPALIKCDIEGGEFELAAELARFLRRNRSRVLLSTHAKFLFKQRQNNSRSRIYSQSAAAVAFWYRLRKVSWIITFRGSHWRVWDESTGSWIPRHGRQLFQDLSRLDNRTFLISSRALSQNDQ